MRGGVVLVGGLDVGVHVMVVVVVGVGTCLKASMTCCFSASVQSGCSVVVVLVVVVVVVVVATEV